MRFSLMYSGEQVLSFKPCLVFLDVGQLQCEVIDSLLINQTICFFSLFIGIKGILMYNLRQPRLFPKIPDPEDLCLDWYDELKDQEFLWDTFLICPCNRDMIWWDPWIFDDNTVDTGYEDVECFDTWRSWRVSPNAMVLLIFF